MSNSDGIFLCTIFSPFALLILQKKNTMSRLKIALQKSGRLSEDSQALLRECGIKFTNDRSKLISTSSNFPIEILFLRDDDIPYYVEQQIADIGIIGENVLVESPKEINVIKQLGFSACRLSLAVPKDFLFNDLSDFNDKTVATSYPHILKQFFQKNGINSSVEILGGSVEIAPSIGLADAIFDIVSSGNTLRSNGLKEAYKVMDSEAILIANKQLDDEKIALLNKLLFRVEAVNNAKSFYYIVLNAPNTQLNRIAQLLPGINSPTILPLAKENWSSLHSVISEEAVWDSIDCLKEAGAEGILILPINKMIR